MTVKPLKILNDDPELQPILEFEETSDTIAGIVMGTDPKFTIGIYGEWGTGKTTLMNLSEKKILSNSKTLCVSFNAWKHEREEEFIIVSLIKTIAYATGKHDSYKQLESMLLRSVKLMNKEVLREVLSQFSDTISFEELTAKLTSNLDQLDESDKNTVYFEGLNKIEEEIENITISDPEHRIVVFVEDIDRCSSNKALELFESLKIFLDIKGLVFVIGLSHETISKLISKITKDFKTKGDNYIRKIIQIPIIIPDWKDSDILRLIESLSNKLDEKYARIILDKKGLITEVTEKNPREVKRFINYFITSSEIHTNQIKSEELLVVQALRMRWYSFYRDYLGFSHDERLVLREYVNLDNKVREQKLNEKRHDTSGLPLGVNKIILDISNDLWEFLVKIKDNLFSIEDWDKFRQITEVSNDIPTAVSKKEERFIRLLQSGKIEEFNELREESKINVIDLSGIELLGQNLKGISFQRADLSKAIFSGSDLTGSNFGNAVLEGVDLTGTNLSNAELPSANLSKCTLDNATLRNSVLKSANLKNSSMKEIDLSDADLENVDLTNCNLLKANLRNAVIIGADLRSAKLQNADLRNTRMEGIGLNDAVLTKAILRNTSLQNGDLEGVDLTDADVSYSALNSVNLTGATLVNTNLTNSDLSNADLRNANLTNANFDSTLLDGTNFQGSDLKDANLENANLKNTILKNVKNLPISREEAIERKAIVD